jgi:hypothetical protein
MKRWDRQWDGGDGDRYVQLRSLESLTTSRKDGVVNDMRLSAGNRYETVCEVQCSLVLDGGKFAASCWRGEIIVRPFIRKCDKGSSTHKPSSCLYA